MWELEKALEINKYALLGIVIQGNRGTQNGKSSPLKFTKLVKSITGAQTNRSKAVCKPTSGSL